VLLARPARERVHASAKSQRAPCRAASHTLPALGLLAVPHRSAFTRTRRIGAAVLALALATLAAELALRWMLFGSWPGFATWRRADRYAEPLGEDDYWKLQVAFRGAHQPAKQPHPLLGWVGRFDPHTYRHWAADELGERRPVLMYGDSFAVGVPPSRSFHEILNGDAEFSARHYLLNYGVSGYGVDQILLLLRQTVDLHERPFVVLSLMTFDLDRSVLSVRPGQKPRFRVEAGELVLEPTVFARDPYAHHAAHPPAIRSYLWRGLLYSGLVPRSVRAVLLGERAAHERIRRLNEPILLAAFDELRRRELDFVCLVFHPHAPGISALDGPPDWRDEFLRELLERERVPYLWSKDMLPPRAPGEAFDAARFILPGDGHPTTEFNELIAQRIKDAVLARD
jgi:hypothetical protein